MPLLKASEIPLPKDSYLRKTMPKADYEEAFSRILPNLSPNISAGDLIERMFRQIPPFVKFASNLKGKLLMPFGFSPVSPERFKWSDFGFDQRIGIFEDRPFTAHIGISINRSKNEVVLANRILLHTTWGRIYFELIKPLHKLAFRFLLNSL